MTETTEKPQTQPQYVNPYMSNPYMSNPMQMLENMMLAPLAKQVMDKGITMKNVGYILLMSSIPSIKKKLEEFVIYIQNNMFDNLKIIYDFIKKIFKKIMTFFRKKDKGDKIYESSPVEIYNTGIYYLDTSISEDITSIFIDDIISNWKYDETIISTRNIDMLTCEYMIRYSGISRIIDEISVELMSDYDIKFIENDGKMKYSSLSHYDKYKFSKFPNLKNPKRMIELFDNKDLIKIYDMYEETIWPILVKDYSANNGTITSIVRNNGLRLEQNGYFGTRDDPRYISSQLNIMYNFKEIEKYKFYIFFRCMYANMEKNININGDKWCLTYFNKVSLYFDETLLKKYSSITDFGKIRNSSKKDLYSFRSYFYTSETQKIVKNLEMTIYNFLCEDNNHTDNLDAFKFKLSTKNRSIKLDKFFANYLKQNIFNKKETTTLYDKCESIRIYSIQLQKKIELKEIFDIISKSKSKSGIIVFEDIDAQTHIVHKRVKDSSDEEKEGAIYELIKSKDDSLDLSYFLNLLDGTISQDDTVFIMTTNYIESLDPALYRSGRMDMISYLLKYISRLIFKYA